MNGTHPERRLEGARQPEAHVEAVAPGRIHVVAQQDRNIHVALAMRAPLDLAAEQIDRDDARPRTLGESPLGYAS